MSQNSGGIDRLMAIAQAEGDLATTEAGEGSVVHTMGRQMSDEVNKAGNADSSLSYLQSLDAAAPTEGFIDEQNDVLVVFPMRPGIAKPEEPLLDGRKPSWFTRLLPALLCLVGAAQLLLAVVQGGNWLRAGVGVLLLVAGFIAWRKRPSGRM